MGHDLARVTTTLAVFGLNWLLQSSVLLALGLAAGRLARGRGPAIQSAVYRTTLAAVLICPIASALLGAAGFDGFSLRLPEPEAATVAPVVSQPIVERTEELPNPEVAFHPPSLAEEPTPTIPEAAEPAEIEASQPVTPAEVRSSRLTLATVSAIGLAAWGLGSLFLGLRLVVQQRRMRRLRAGATPADADTASLCRAVATRMNVANPTVWRSPFLFSPCLDGLRRPAILLPDDVDEDLHDTFVHELAHLARRDGLWNLVRRLAAAVLWFQPLLWVLSRRLEATAEEVCDDYVVHFGGDRAKYAGLLVELAGRALPPRSPAAVGMISVRSMLARRVVRILDTSRSLSTRAGKKAIFATLALGLASTAFAGLLGVGGRPLPPDTPGQAESAPPEEAKAPAPDVPITGRIVDLEGRPVAGVVVSVEGVQTPKTGDVSPWIEAVRKGEPPWLANRRVEWEATPSKHKDREEKTDADGRFRLDGLEADGIVHLIVRGETIACSNLDVVTRKMESISVQGGGNRYGSGARNVHGADFTFVAAPTRPYDGVVKDAETGKPVAGVELRSYRFSGADQNAVMTLRTRSDGEGRFRMTGLPIGAGNVILLVPAEDQPYLLQEIPLPGQPAKDPATVQVAVKKGIWIEGRLTEEGTGRPISEARLYYLPFLTNTFVQGHPAFNKNGEMDGHFYQDHNLTKADGSFRLVGLPGRAIVGAEASGGYRKGAGAEAIAGMSGEGHFATYMNPIEASRLWLTTMKEIDPPADAKVVHVDLEGFHGDSVRLRVVDGDARPLNGLTIRGRTERGSYLDGETGESNVEVSNLQPDEVRTVLFQHNVRRLGKSIRVRKGDDAKGPIVVTLEPFAQLSGRVVDEEGQPVGEATVSSFLMPYGDFTLALPQAVTTRDGKFHIPDVPIGCDYRLAINSRKPSRFALREAVAVKPGETTDVGEIRFEKEGDKAAQATKPAPADVPITGRIVDLEGRPVVGMVVTMERVKTPKGGDLTVWLNGVKDRKPSYEMDRGAAFQSKKVETKTDADGRFRIGGVEPDRVALLSLKGDTTAYATIQVATRIMEPIAAPGFPNRHGPGSESIYGVDFTYTAAPSRLIEGIVTDSKTGRPLAETEVRSYHFAGSGANESYLPSLICKTDSEGHFRIAGMPKGKDNKLLVVPNDEQPYFLHEVEVPDPPGSTLLKLDVPLHEGVWIEGKLTEQSTGMPIPEARMHYFPFRTNPFAQAIPEFGTRSTPAGAGYQDRYTTKADGRFRLVGLPGRGIVGAEMFGGPKKYMAGAGAEGISELSQPGRPVTYYNPGPPGRAWPTVMKAIDPPADAKTVHVDLEAVNGDLVHVRLVASDGQPISGIQTQGLGNPGVGDRVTLDGEECDATNLQPGEERTVVFRLKGRKLGKVVRVRKGDDARGAVVAMLEPLAALSGRVVDADGVPVSGAVIRTTLLPIPKSFGSSLETVVSDNDGRFVVPDVPIGCEYSLRIQSGRTLKPQGFADVTKAVVRPGETTDLGEIRFKKEGEQAAQATKPAPADVPITGRIIDLEGRPVAGVVVKIGGVQIPKGDDLSAWIEGVKKGEPPWVVARLIDWNRKTPEFEGRETKTDADGRFRFDGLGAERVVGLSLRGETIAYTTIDVVSRKTGPIPAKGFSNQYGAGAETVFGADFTYTAAPSRPVEGIVKDAKTGEPLADAGVWSYRFAGSDFVGTTALKTRTDAQGGFRLTGLPKGKGNTLLVVPNDEQPYFMQEFELADPAGTEPVKADVAMHKGIWIEGKLTEQETGKPVPNAWLHYLPFLSNPFAQATPVFDKDGNTDGVGFQDRYKSKADGSFRLVGLPGRAIVGAVALYNDRELQYMQGAGSDKIAGMKPNGHFETFRNPVNPGKLWPTVLKEIDPPADAQTVHVDLQTSNGDSVKVRIVDSNGGPVSKLESLGRQSRGSYDAKPVETSDAEVTHLYPGEERNVMFRLRERKLGKVVRVKKGDDDKGPVVVTLEPLATLTGAVVDPDGVPVMGATVRPHLLPSGDFSAHLSEVSADDKGRFVVPDVPTGCDYSLAVDSLGAIKSRRYAFFEKAIVKPGETTDVGEIRFKREGEQAAQATKPAPAEVPITGRIVDLEGRPVAGAVVKVRSVQAPNNDGLSAWIDAVKKGELEGIASHRLQNSRPGYEFVGSLIKTDADGRFRIEGLRADRVVELLLTGESIAYQTIRLVTRPTVPFTAEGFMNRYGPGPTIFHGPDFTYTATPGRPIEGIVKDARTGRPLADVEVKSERFAGANQLGVRDLEIRSDAEGRFRIAGMPKAKGNMIRAVPPGEQPYFAHLIQVPDPAGLGPVQVEIALNEGIWIEGELTDQRSGKPIFEARLYYFPFLSNPFAQAIPGFAQDFSSGDDVRFMTKADGTFRLLGLPGRGIVGALAPQGDPYMLGAGSEKIAGMNPMGQFETFRGAGWPGKHWPTVMKEIDPPADAKDAHLDLEATIGASVRLRVVDADGQSLPNVKSEGRTNRGGLDSGFLDAPDTVVSKLRPDEERTVLFRQLDGKLGKAVRVRPGDDADRPVVVKLEPLATITGRIADADGVAVPGAMIQPCSLPLGDFTPRLSVVVSDAAGRFVVPNVPIGCDYQLVFHHRRTSKSDRMATLEKAVVKPGETTDVGEIRFKGEGEQAAQDTKPAPAEVPITGRIVDLENRPVADVVVKIESIKKAKDDDLTAWLDAVKRGETEGVAGRRLVEDGKRGETKTDADGRFRFDGLEADRVVEMSLTGTTIAYTTITAVTRTMAPVPARGLWNHYGPSSTTIQGADFSYSAAPSHPVEGVVKDARTGKPLAGVEIRITSFAGSSFGGIKAPNATTDAQGRFQINGIPKKKGTSLLIVPNDEQAYFMQSVAVPNPDGPAPIKIEVALHEGIWIEGKLTEQGTGKPIPDARVQYFPYRTNEFAQAVPEFGRKSSYDGNLLRDRYTTKADGSFRLVGLPGKAVVGAEVVRGPNRYMAGAGAESLSQIGKDRLNRNPTYVSSKAPGRDWPTVMKEIDPPADAKVARVDLEAIEGDSVHVRVVDPDGRPISGLEAVGREGPQFLTDLRESEPSPAECDVEHLQPGEARTVIFRHAARGLGKVVRFKKGDDANGPVVVKLEPLATITGRIVDKDGAAVPSATTLVRLSESTVTPRHADMVTNSGRDGRFSIPNLPTGGDYTLSVGRASVIASSRSEALQKIAVQPGRTIDVGAVPIEGPLLETAKAPAPDVPITGRIVDLEGRPIAGVAVTIQSVQVPTDGDLTAWIEVVKRGEDDAIAEKRLKRDRQDIDAIGSRTRTDSDGRFRFENVQADRVVELHATGESIAFQAIHLVTRATAPFLARGFSTRYGPGPMNFHGSDFTYTATPGRPIEGFVKDAKTGRPIAGVEVQSRKFAGADMGGITDLETKTDAEGRFRITGMPKAKGNELAIIPATGQPYFIREIPVPDPAGLEPVKVEVALHEGIWIEGKVTDQSTGKPIAEARLHYLPFLSNTFAQATPEFSKGFAREDEFRFMTKADGSFRLLGLPGRAIVGADAPEGPYMRGAGSEKIAGMNARGQFETCSNPIRAGKNWPTVMKEIDPPGDAKVVHVDLQATAGVSVRVRLVGPDLRPLTGVESEGRESRGSTDHEALNLPDTVVAHLGPGEERPVIFRHEGRKLGKLVRVRSGDDVKGPVVVKLEPLATITGRIVDEDGAAAGTKIQSVSLPLADSNLGLPRVASDADGRFVLPDVPTGCDYWLQFDGRRKGKSSRFTTLKKVVVKPGETTDVGEIRFKKD